MTFKNKIRVDKKKDILQNTYFYSLQGDEYTS